MFRKKAHRKQIGILERDEIKQERRSATLVRSTQTLLQGYWFRSYHNVTKQKNLLTRWPNWRRVSRSRMRGTRTPAIKRCSWIMFRSRVPRSNAKRKFILESCRPSIMALVLRKINSAIVPGIAVATVAGLHRDQRRPRRVRRCLLEERAWRAGMILAAIEERGDGRNTPRLAEFVKERSSLTGVIPKG